MKIDGMQPFVCTGSTQLAHNKENYKKILI
jgi:hypothetical protein